MRSTTYSLFCCGGFLFVIFYHPMYFIAARARPPWRRQCAMTRQTAPAIAVLAALLYAQITSATPVVVTVARHPTWITINPLRGLPALPKIHHVSEGIDSSYLNPGPARPGRNTTRAISRALLADFARITGSPLYRIRSRRDHGDHRERLVAAERCLKSSK